MKKVFWLVLGSVIALTACDDKPKTSEQTKTTVEKPTQKVASINYKQIALDKSKPKCLNNSNDSAFIFSSILI